MHNYADQGLLNSIVKLSSDEGELYAEPLVSPLSLIHKGRKCIPRYFFSINFSAKRDSVEDFDLFCRPRISAKKSSTAGEILPYSSHKNLNHWKWICSPYFFFRSWTWSLSSDRSSSDQSGLTYTLLKVGWKSLSWKTSWLDIALGRCNSLILFMNRSYSSCVQSWF